MKKEYKLCYIYGNKAFFTDNFEKQCGDDWNDAPYEHNAEEPYKYYYEKGIEYPIKIIELYYEIPYCSYLPCDICYPNSPYSVEMINKGAIAWITAKDFIIMAGTSVEEFKKIIKDHGGKIFVEEV